MKIAAVTRFKSGVLYEVLRSLDWTAAELARRTGVHPSTIYNTINLRRRPSQSLIDAIQGAFGKAGIFIDASDIWPPNFSGFKRSVVVSQVQDVEISALEGYREKLLEDAEHNSNLQELMLDWPVVNSALQALSDREREVIEGHILNEKTLDEVGKSLSLSKERVRQLEAIGLHKIRCLLAKRRLVR